MIPYLVSPDQTVPGVSTHYATLCRECSAGCGVIAEVRDGRAIKLEGNPAHPLNRGALCARGQAALQGLYNPDRYRGPMVREQPRGIQGPRLYRFGRRGFHPTTVKRLIEAGEARRVGDRVERVQ